MSILDGIEPDPAVVRAILGDKKGEEKLRQHYGEAVGSVVFVSTEIEVPDETP